MKIDFQKRFFHPTTCTPNELPLDSAMSRFIDQFDIILLDQGKTFMFKNDRFGPNSDYYATYQRLGGTKLPEDQLRAIITKLFDKMLQVSRDPNQYDAFPSVSECLQQLTEAQELFGEESQRLDDLVGLHEVGKIPDSSQQAIKHLAETHRLGIVSNIWARKDCFIKTLKDYGIDSCFDHMVWSSDYRCIKPSPKIFKISLEYFGTEPSKILFVGDNPLRDIHAAKSLGLSTAWVKNGRDAFPKHYLAPDLVIQDLTELI